MGHHNHHSHSHTHENTPKSLKDKLKILVRHWIEHNNSHLQEYKKWKEVVKAEGLIDIEELLKEVCYKVEELDKLYKKINKLLDD